VSFLSDWVSCGKLRIGSTIVLPFAGMMGAVSGPKAPDFTQGELTGALAALGYDKSQVFKF
jgi:hypothetical protein